MSRESQKDLPVGILFLLFAAVLICGVFFLGVPISQASIEERRYRDVFLLAIGLLGALGALTGLKFRVRGREDRVIVWAGFLLPGYALLQMVPLPSALVGILSPARGELLRGLEPLYGHRLFASLSIVPSATFTHFLLLTSYCILFLVAREYAARAGDKAWIVAVPVVVAAAAEAVLGLVQFSSGNNIVASGTYVIRNHFAGLLDMALPFAVLYALHTFRNVSIRERTGAAAALRLCAGLGSTALLLVGTLCSLSRGGFVSLAGAGLVMVALTVSRNMPIKNRLLILSLFSVLAAVALFYLTPVQMVARFSQHTSAGRLSIWSQGLGVIGEYPLVGCGLGGFESAFLKFKIHWGLINVDYAHNDYLQYLSELGAAGFLVGAVLIGGVAMRVGRIATEATEPRFLALACVGSLATMLIHSAMDFNLYVVANAAVFAWICGLAAGLKPIAAVPSERVIELASVEQRRSTPFR
jgi:O-antigen ligase